MCQLTIFSVTLQFMIVLVLISVLNAVKIETTTEKIDKWWLTVSLAYPKQKAITKLFKEMEATFPNLVKLDSPGRSVAGRDMWTVNLRRDIQKPKPLGQPSIKVVANIHGNEALGRALVLMLIVDLIKKYHEGYPRALQLLSSTDIHLLPSINPDGFEIAREGCVHPLECGSGTGCKNYRGVDLNKNFPEHFSEKQISADKRQTETRNMMDFIESNDFVLSLSFRGGATVVVFPFDSVPLSVEKQGNYTGHGVPSLTPDNDIFVFLAMLYAGNHKILQAGPDHRCRFGLGSFYFGITNGAWWSNQPGGMQDYNYLYSNAFEITVEPSCCKYPAATELSKEWSNNNESIYKFMEAAHRGIRGFVTDPNGLPVQNAEVFVTNRNRSVKVTTKGEYWRLLLPGNYTIGARASGHHPSKLISIQVIEVPIDNPIIVNFTLILMQPSSASSLPTTQNFTNFLIYFILLILFPFILKLNDLFLVF